ncbi:MAG: GAF domain-containing protein [Piscinibacter sp.]|uniref:GAF domain-containing protein n=1 Tax=Piscinibacter TaxID=1114981 RepID=UPI000FDE9430|nr:MULTISPECIES: GAF domain-containing protein [Piscinibacter]MCW5663466.1 GAF domain-containing protein [Piscinibacter sp.]
MPDLHDIQEICGRLDRGEIDRVRFLEQFTEALAAQIGCTRAGVWIFIDTAEGRALRCLAMYDRRYSGMVTATDMLNAAVGPYFDALLADGCVIASDARNHATTRIFLEDYLEPQDIHSVLDVCFSINGVLFGTFSCEQTGAPVTWTQRQLQLVRQIGSRASLALLHAATATIDTEPAALWEPSSPNRLLTQPLPLPLPDDKP